MNVRDRLFSTTGFVVVVGLVVVVGVALANAIVITQTEERLTERLDDRIIIQARTTAAALRLVDEAEQPVVLEATALGGREQAVAVVTRSDAGEVVVPSGPAFDPDPEPVLPGFAMLEGRLGEVFGIDEPVGYRVGAVAIDDNRVLVVAERTSEIEHTIDDLAAIITLAGLTALTAILAVAALVIVLARRPITESIAVAEAIAAGNLDARVDHRATTHDTRRLTSALNRMVDALRSEAAGRNAADARVRGFVAVASHELRTPLTSIRAYVELLRQGMVTDQADRVRALERVSSESARMSKIIDGLLDLALLDQEASLDLLPVDLAAIAADVVDDARAASPDRTFVLDAPPEPPVVLGDELRLRQVVGNLVTNARIHGAGTVLVRLTADDDEVKLAVADEGAGLTPEEAASAFERFWRSDRSRRLASGGTGLGLAVVAAIVGAHGGSVGVAHEIESGAAFVVTLPAHQAAPLRPLRRRSPTSELSH